jgi:hypothetical protein
MPCDLYQFHQHPLLLIQAIASYRPRGINWQAEIFMIEDEVPTVLGLNFRGTGCAQ